MTRIERIFADFLNFIFLIRANPLDPLDPCSIFGCGLATLCFTFYVVALRVYECVNPMK